MHWLLLPFLINLSPVGSFSYNQNEKELIFLQMVFRNGFSSPSRIYLNDPHDTRIWEEGMGELTLTGRKQLFALGKQLRKRYNNFITTAPIEITMQTSAKPKSLRSGLCVLASLYKPTKEWEFLPGLPWQPVPIFYIPSDQDKMLVGLRDCPLIVQQMDKLVEIYGTDTVLDMYEQQFKFWTLNSGSEIKDWNDVVYLYRILSTQHASNHTLPDWAWKYWKEMECLNDYAYKINFNDPKILKVVGGPILWTLVGNARDKSKGELNNTKIMAFSAQSSHVAGYLGALKNFNDKEPPFASIVLMELFKNKQSEDHSIRWIYMNGTDTRVLHYSECQEFCPLEHVVNKAKHWSNPKWGRDCRGETPLDQLKELLAGIRI